MRRRGQTLEATLTVDRGQTLLVIETHGMPVDKIAFYGAGWQIHAESLASYLGERSAGDTEARWDELVPLYQEAGSNHRLARPVSLAELPPHWFAATRVSAVICDGSTA